MITRIIFYRGPSYKRYCWVFRGPVDVKYWMAKIASDKYPMEYLTAEYLDDPDTRQPEPER